MTTESESLKTSHVASNSIIHTVHVYLLNKNNSVLGQLVLVVGILQYAGVSITFEVQCR